MKNWDRIKAGAASVKDWVTDKFGALVDFFKGKPGRIGRAFSGLFDGLKDAFRGAGNFIIDGWNNLSFSLPGVSIAGKEGNPGAVPYGAAKAGVIGLAKGLARELLPSDITVNCIAPSMAMTDLLDGMSADYIADKKSRIPMGRLCTPEEIANVAAFIASPACSFTTGQVFDVTGGRATW